MSEIIAEMVRAKNEGGNPSSIVWIHLKTNLNPAPTQKKACIFTKTAMHPTKRVR